MHCSLKFAGFQLRGLHHIVIDHPIGLGMIKSQSTCHLIPEYDLIVIDERQTLISREKHP